MLELSHKSSFHLVCHFKPALFARIGRIANSKGFREISQNQQRYCREELRKRWPPLIPRIKNRLSAFILRTFCSQSEKMFSQRLNTVTGEVEWQVVQLEPPKINDSSSLNAAAEANNVEEVETLSMDPSGAIARSLYLDMLNDTKRNDAYYEAIKRTVKQGDRILDIGSGTGLLAMMAARTLQEKTPREHSPPPMVVTCEAFPPVASLARKILRANGMETAVKLVEKRSDELVVGPGKDSDHKFDVIISEILDSELIGEGVLPTMRVARERFLAEGGRVLPHSATVFGQLVECDLPQFHNSPDSTNLDHYAHNWQVLVDPLRPHLRLLSDPFKVFDFDFKHPPEPGRTTACQVALRSPGTVNALVSWWTLNLDGTGEVSYSTAPRWVDQSGPPNFALHWKQCVWKFPGNGVAGAEGERLSVRATHGDTRFAYELEGVPENPSLGLRVTLERFMAAKDEKLLGKYREIVADLLGQSQGATCLLLDDSSTLPGVILAANGSARVAALFPSQDWSSVVSAMERAGFGSRLAVLGKRASEIQGLSDIGASSVNFVLCEPYYKVNESQLPWSNLRFWHEIDHLRTLNLGQNFKLSPSSAVLKCCLAYLPDLWKSRRGMKEVSGFEHELANSMFGGVLSSAGAESQSDLVLSGEILPAFLWQCGRYKEMSAECTVFEFDFSGPPKDSTSAFQIPLERPGTCHALVLWMEWRTETSWKEIVVSCRPSSGEVSVPPTIQAVQFFRAPFSVVPRGGTGVDRALRVAASFDHRTCSVCVTAESGSV